jgi:hypothetical protein
MAICLFGQLLTRKYGNHDAASRLPRRGFLTICDLVVPREETMRSFFSRSCDECGEGTPISLVQIADDFVWVCARCSINAIRFMDHAKQVSGTTHVKCVWFAVETHRQVRAIKRIHAAHKLLADESGSILVLATLMMTTIFLIGLFGLNLGVLAYRKAILESAVDAAALSGTSALPSGNLGEVVSRARSLDNGVPPEFLDVTVIDSKHVKVRAVMPVKLFLLSPQDVSVEATAELHEIKPDASGDLPRWCKELVSPATCYETRLVGPGDLP